MYANYYLLRVKYAFILRLNHPKQGDMTLRLNHPKLGDMTEIEQLTLE